MLKSIEAQHGLLIERARNIYSFSHLTFQEYFAARQIKEQRDDALLRDVVSHVAEKRWGEVFRLTVEMLPDASQFLQMMKGEIDVFFGNCRAIELFLRWLEDNAKSTREEFYLKEFSLPAVRAFLLDIFLDNHGLHDSSFRNDVYYVGLYIPGYLERVCSSDHVMNLRIANVYHFSWYSTLASKIDCNFSYDSISNSRAQPIDYEGLPKSESWWAEFESHAITVSYLMNKYEQIRQRWQFDKEQYQLLQQYYDANKLLVDCLNSECYVNPRVRQEIEETLLLPFSASHNSERMTEIE